MAGTIAFDAYSADDANVNVDASWTHTPVGTPRAALVFLAMTNTSTDNVVGVTYGGTAMTEVTGSPRTHSAGADDSVIHFFFLDNVASGAQTVAVDVVTPAATTYRAGVVTVTTNGGAAEVDTTAGGDSGAGTDNGGTVTLATTASRDTVCVWCWHSGENAVTSTSVDQTELGEYDYGTQVSGHARADGAGGNVSNTLTISADSWHMMGVALGSQDPPAATGTGWYSSSAGWF